jgi:hypothetical protein
MAPRTLKAELLLVGHELRICQQLEYSYGP